MKGFIKLINNGELIICIALVYVLLLVSTFSVLSRYVFPTPLMWSEELSRYLFMWLAFLSCAFAIERNSQLAIDILPEFVLSKKPILKKIVRVITDIGFIMFALFLIKYGWENAANTIELSAALKIPMVFVYASVPVGGLLIAARLVQDIIRTIQGKYSVKSQEE